MRLAALLVGIATLGCSSGGGGSPAPRDGAAGDAPILADVDAAAAAGITGKWCSDLARLDECGENVPMLDITQTGADVTGTLCKKDCYPVTGSVSGSTFTFSNPTPVGRSDTTLTITGATMNGDAVISGTKYPVTFSRMP